MSLAYNVNLWHGPTGTNDWYKAWATASYGASFAPQIATIMQNYSMYAGRRKYELMDEQTYSVINYNEADTALQQWTTLVNAAQSIYNQLPANAQASFFEMILHPALAGQTVYQIYIGAAKQNLYAMQGRTSANTWVQAVLNYAQTDASLTQEYNGLLDGYVISQTLPSIYFFESC